MFNHVHEKKRLRYMNIHKQYKYDIYSSRHLKKLHHTIIYVGTLFNIDHSLKIH